MANNKILDCIETYLDNKNKVSYWTAKCNLGVVSEDIIINGNDLVAFWDSESKCWVKCDFGPSRLINFVDESLIKTCPHGANLGLWSEYANSRKFLEGEIKHLSTKYKISDMDKKLLFLSDNKKKSDLSTTSLSYDPADIATPYFDKFVDTCYGEEINKILWAAGCALCNENLKIQKALFLYGQPGTGKSTLLKILEMIFENYSAHFSVDELADSTNKFSTAQLKDNPSVALCDEANLSRIDTNSTLNDLFSHDTLLINEKHAKAYTMQIRSICFICSNHVLAFTGSDSGLQRRIIDVNPTGDKLTKSEYDEVMRGIRDEIPGIAYKCIQAYKNMGHAYYNKYVPVQQKILSDTTYTFVNEWIENSEIGSMYPLDSKYVKGQWINVKNVYGIYKQFSEEMGIKYKKSYLEFKTDFMHYFEETVDSPEQKRLRNDDGTEFRKRGAWVKNFKSIDTRFEPEKVKEVDSIPNWLKLDAAKNDILADYCSGCLAQYADEKEHPATAWDLCESVIDEIDTSKLHYLLYQNKHPNLVVVDFDKTDSTGKKDLSTNIAKAIELGLPKTYAEASKSGGGLHLHYIVDGDITSLASKWPEEEGVEIKVYTGKMSLRRKLSICNKELIAHIKSDILPKMKERKPVLSDIAIQNQDHLRNCINKALRKDIKPGSTVCCVSFIKQKLDEAYESGVSYDVRDMQGKVFTFCMQSTNSKKECLEMFNRMKFCNIEVEMEDVEHPDKPLAFYDIEVVPNLLLIEYMEDDDNAPVHKMFNPEPKEVEKLWLNYRLIGYNNRGYDNHIIYNRGKYGASNEALYNQSKILVKEKDFNVKKKATFAEAYGDVSYADLYDIYGAKDKRLKDWEIELGIDHVEWDMDWDKPLDESEWERFGMYCENDVRSTRAVYHAIENKEFQARVILSKLSGLSIMNTTNSHTQQIIFGKDRHPQDKFNYRNMGDISTIDEEVSKKKLEELTSKGLNIMYPEYFKFDSYGRPVYPGYVFDHGHSTYRNFGADPSDKTEGGYAKGIPGMYGPSWTFDVASQHPSSTIAENLFGTEYTDRYHDLLRARLAFKHGDVEAMKTLLDGKLAIYADKPELWKAIQKALKLAINSVYGMTSASIAKGFRCTDPRNIDNIVAKRGALTMCNLENEVIANGYKVIHIKTDSIKIENPDEYIINFVMEYGKAYGYNFEIEHKFEKICLVNDSVYIAKVSEEDEDWADEAEKAVKDGKPIPTRWTATGKEFQIPYVFKTLFSGEELNYNDVCVKCKVSGASIYVDYTNGLPDVSTFEMLKATRIKENKINNNLIKSKLTRAESALLLQYADYSDEDIENEISKGHKYEFVGGVGNFVPVKSIYDSGDLIRIDDTGNRQNVTDTSGYKWLEAGKAKSLSEELGENWGSIVDFDYFKSKNNDAIEEISMYGDFYTFADIN